jgi:putative tributyrin esterase
MHRIFGGRPVAGTPDDLFWLLDRRAADPSAAPALQVFCGTEDSHLAENERFLAAARGAGLAVTARLGPGGHDWRYWSRAIGDVLHELPFPGAPGDGRPRWARTPVEGASP